MASLFLLIFLSFNWIFANLGAFGFSQLCFDLIEKWVSEKFTGSILGTEGGNLNISGIAAYQPCDGLIDLKMV